MKKFLLPVSLFLLLFSFNAFPQELNEGDYINLRKNLCCYKNSKGAPIEFSSDNFSIVLSDSMVINYSSPENIFTFEQKRDTMFFMNSEKLKSFLDAVVLTLNQDHWRKLPKLIDNVFFIYNGHTINLRYLTRTQDFKIKEIDNGDIIFQNWSGGFVLKTPSFRKFMHSPEKEKFEHKF